MITIKAHFQRFHKLSSEKCLSQAVLKSDFVLKKIVMGFNIARKQLFEVRWVLEALLWWQIIIRSNFEKSKKKIIFPPDFTGGQ